MGAEISLSAQQRVVGPAARRRLPKRRSVRIDRETVLLALPAIVFLLLALIGPALAPSATNQDLLNRLVPPVGFGGSWAHPLGTDGLGRDLLARTAGAARISLSIGLGATLITGIAGVVAGLVAGVAGGVLDRMIMTLVDAQLAVPFVVIGIAIAATLGQSPGTVMATLVITGWVTFARIVRLQARSLAASPFVEAAVAMGAGRSRILFRHVLPNVCPAIIVIASQMVAAMILYEASLSYLGIGLPSSSLSLGGLVRDGQTQIFEAWWASAVPGLALALAVFAFNLLGEEFQRHWRRA